MCTSTRVDRDARPAQPPTAIVPYTVRRSGTGRSVPLVGFQHGGGTTTGGAGGGAVYSSRFGVPGSGLVMRPADARSVSVAATCAGASPGFAARISAAAPATCGVAIEVPLIQAVAVSPLPWSDRMLTPGANRSTHGPSLDHGARASCTSLAATVSASGVSAGETVHASTGLPCPSPLPAATAYVTPCPIE